MKRLVLGLAVFGLVSAGVLVAPGLPMEPGDLSERRAHYAQPPDRLWEVITDWEASAKWRRSVDRVERLGGCAEPTILEHGENGPIPYRIVREEAPEVLVLEMADPDLGFAGTWTWTLNAVDDGTELKITERGEITNLPMRSLAPLFHDPGRTQDEYLVDLGHYLGEEVDPGP